MKYLYGKRIKTLKDRVTTLVASLAILANSAGVALPILLTQRVAAATTISVCATGCDYATIQEAVNDAAAGDTVIVGDGTYAENVSINKSLTLKSANGAGSTIIDPSAGNVISFPTGNGIVRDSITIEGFTLVGSSGAIALQANSHTNDGYNSTNLTYRNLVIEANGGTGLGLFDVNGIVIDNVNITNAILGVEAIGVTNLEMKNSQISSSSNIGFNVWSHAGYEENGNLALTNVAFINNKTGLKSSNTANLTITGGSFSGGELGIVSQGSTTIVEGVTFDNIKSGTVQGTAVAGLGGYVAGGFGAGTYGSNDLTVRNSTFTNIGRIGVIAKGDQSQLSVEGIDYTGKGSVTGLDYAVEFGAGAKGSVVDSSIRDNLGIANDGSTSAGILATDFYGNGTEATLVQGNTITNSVSGIAVGYNNTDVTKATVLHNNIYDNTTWGISAKTNTNVDASLNWWGDRTGPDGSGNSVSVSVAYQPWLCQLYTGQANPRTSADSNCEDVTDAVTQILTPAKDEHIADTYRFSGTATDDDTGVDRVLIRIGTQVGNDNVFTDWTEFDPETGEWFLDVDTKNIPDGIYNVRARAVDNAGNNGNSGMHVLRDFTIDNTPPTFSLTDDGSPRTTITDGMVVNPDLLGDRDNNGSSIRFAKESSTDKLYLNGKLIFGHGYVSGKSGQIGAAFKNEGVYTLYTEDLAGNQSESITFTVDKTAPAQPQVLGFYKDNDKTKPIIPCGGYTNSTKILIDWEDGESDVAYYWLGTKFNKYHRKVTVSEYRANMTPGNNPYYYTVIAVDYAGNESGVSDQCGLTLDQEAPNAPVVTLKTSPSGDIILSGGLTNSLGVVASWTTGPDDAGYQYRYWNSIPGDHYSTNYYVTQPTAAFQSGTFNRGEGLHHIQVRTIDLAGNWSGWSTVFNVTYDATAPTIVIDEPSVGDVLNGNTLNITGEVSDAHMRYYYCYLTTGSTISYNGTTYTPGQEVGVRDSDCVTKWTNTSVSGALGSVDLTGLPDGGYTINLVAYDQAGNHNAASPASVSFILDNTAPTTNLDMDAVNPTGYTLHADDANGVDKITAIIRETTAANGPEVTAPCGKTILAGGVTDFDITCTLPTNLTDGEYNIRYNATDIAGNTLLPSKQFNFTIDNTAPTVSVNDITAITVGNNAIVTGTVDDPGVSSVEILVNGVLEDTAGVTAGAFSFNVSGLGVGTHPITVRATDDAGNVGEDTKSVSVGAVESAFTNTPGGSEEAPNINTASTSRNPSTTSNVTITDNNSGGDTLVEQTAEEPDARVLQATDTANGSDTSGENETEENNGCGKFLGLCWYLWIPIVIVVLGTVYYFSSRRADEK